MVDSALLSRDGHGSANSLRPPDEAVVSVIRTAEEMKEALAIRHQVFVVGQGVPIEEEIDAYDGNGDPQKVSQEVVHVLAHMNGKAVGTGRLLINPPFRQLPKAQRIAVLKEAQGKGVGRRIMLVLQLTFWGPAETVARLFQTGTEQAWARGFRGVALEAQVTAIHFYEKLGYKVQGDVFLDAGLEHKKMERLFGGPGVHDNE